MSDEGITFLDGDKPTVTRLLASVTSVEEAQITLAEGADIIDLKDPSVGALGALPEDIVREVVRFVAGRRPVSCTIGDLPHDLSAVPALVEARIQLGTDFVKMGFTEQDSFSQMIRTVGERYSNAANLVAVFFADQLIELDHIELVAEAGFVGVMVDTADKQSGTLVDCLPLDLIDQFVQKAHSCGLKAGLAGSLKATDVPLLLPFEPDYLGFRGALCSGHDRTARLMPAAVQNIRSLLSGVCHNRSQPLTLTVTEDIRKPIANL